MPGLLGNAQPLTMTVAVSALFDEPLGPEGGEVHQQTDVASRVMRVFRLSLSCPVHMGLRWAVAGLAPHILLMPGSGEGIALTVIAFLQVRGMTICTHGIPVLISPGPVKCIASRKTLTRIKGKPSLPARAGRSAVPGDSQGLQPATREGYQILL
ncbi:hypothetical protein D3C81_1210710 [compost metagenome]